MLHNTMNKKQTLTPYTAPPSDLILLLGGNPSEGTRSDVFRNETQQFGASRQRLESDDRVYFVDLIFAPSDLVHPRLFRVDFNSASQMKEAFSSLEGRFGEIYFDYSTVKFFSVWSFSMLYKLLKPGGTIAWCGGNHFRYLIPDVGQYLSRQEFYRQMEVFGFEGADGEPLRMIEEVLGFHPHGTLRDPYILKRTTLVPSVGVDFAMPMGERYITRTVHNRIYPETALELMDFVSKYHPNDSLPPNYKFWQDMQNACRQKSWADWRDRQCGDTQSILDREVRHKEIIEKLVQDLEEEEGRIVSVRCEHVRIKQLVQRLEEEESRMHSLRRERVERLEEEEGRTHSLECTTLGGPAPNAALALVSTVAAMLQSPLVTSNAGLAMAVLKAVANFAKRETENTAKLGAAGVCEAVAAFLKSPLVVKDYGVAEAALLAVATLAARNVENTTKLCATGVCEAVVVCIRRCPPTAALEAVRSIANGNEESMAKLCAAGVCEAVAALLKSPMVTSNAGEAEAALLAVETLAKGNAENNIKLGAAGVCKAVAALLKSPMVTSNAGVAEAALLAVETLAKGNAENNIKLGAAGVCKAIVRVLQVHAACRTNDLALRGAWAILNVASSDRAIQQRFVAAGARAALETIIADPASSTQAKAIALLALETIIADPASSTQAKEIALLALETIIADPASSTQAKEIALLALEKLE